MKLYYSIISSLLLALLTVLADGCTLKNLNEDAPTTLANNVNVIFDWSKAPDKQASSMLLYLFPEGHDVMNYWFTNADGGLIKTYGVKHTVVCHTNDDPYVHLLRNQHAHNQIEIYTDNTAILVGQGLSTRGLPRAEGTEQEPLRFTPSMIYGAQDTEIDLKVTNFEQTITLYPEELVCHYSVQFVDVKNLKNADLRIDATISSLAGSYFPGRMSPSAEPVSHSFTLAPDEQLTSLSAEFLTFGVPAGEPIPHKVCLYIALKNRTGNFYTFDISDQINNAPDPRHVTIKIPGLELPDIPDDPPPPATGGVSVEVDTWDIINYTIKV